MALSSAQLEAFLAVARSLSFSKAASRLGITQPALSQRIKQLELELEVSLFTRTSSGVVLTPAGERVLQYGITKEALEGELVEELHSSPYELAGVLRVAGFSSTMRSVVIPSLAPLLRRHPRAQIEFMVRRMVDLPGMLKRAEADLVILDYHLNQAGVEERVLGKEELVVVESTQFETRQDVFLDLDSSDLSTGQYFNDLRKGFRYRRGFISDVYGIFEGVELGLGRAVVSKHLIQKEMKIRQVPDYPRYTLDVTVHFLHQPYYSRLQKAALETLLKNSNQFLPEK